MPKANNYTRVFKCAVAHKVFSTKKNSIRPGEFHLHGHNLSIFIHLCGEILFNQIEMIDHIVNRLDYSCVLSSEDPLTNYIQKFDQLLDIIVLVGNADMMNLGKYLKDKIKNIIVKETLSFRLKSITIIETDTNIFEISE